MPAYYTNCKLEKIALSDFRLNVVRALVEEFGVQKSDSRGRPSIETPVGIVARHFPSKVESSSDGRKRCFVCSHTTRGSKHETKISYECKECNVGLCVVPCFKALSSNYCLHSLDSLPSCCSPYSFDFLYYPYSFTPSTPYTHFAFVILCIPCTLFISLHCLRIL